MAEYAQNQDVQPEATSTPPIRPNENDSKLTAWRPLRVPMFRNLLIADLMSDVETFMQGECLDHGAGVCGEPPRKSMTFKRTEFWRSTGRKRAREAGTNPMLPSANAPKNSH